MGCALHIRRGMPRLLAGPGRKARARLVYAALLAFALRALIPVGFMPASDGSFSLMMCPGGFPAELLAGRSMPTSGGMQMPGDAQAPGHQHPGHNLMDEGYCAFTTGFSSAPPPLLLAALFVVLSCIAVIAVAVLPPAGVRLVHVPQARAPPARI
jgi:hypothetical protein